MYFLWSLRSTDLLTQYPGSRNAAPSPSCYQICGGYVPHSCPDKPIANATLCLAECLRTCGYVRIRCPSTARFPVPAYFLITSPTCFFSSVQHPLSILGDDDNMYLHSHRTWERLCHSCIGSSSLSFHGLSRGKPIYFTRIVEPIRVLHRGGGFSQK